MSKQQRSKATTPKKNAAPVVKTYNLRKPGHPMVVLKKIVRSVPASGEELDIVINGATDPRSVEKITMPPAMRETCMAEIQRVMGAKTALTRLEEAQRGIIRGILHAEDEDITLTPHVPDFTTSSTMPDIDFAGDIEASKRAIKESEVETDMLLAELDGFRRDFYTAATHPSLRNDVRMTSVRLTLAGIKALKRRYPEAHVLAFDAIRKAVSVLKRWLEHRADWE